MFRKTLCAVAASLSLLSPLALPSQAQAHEFHHRAYSDYRVYYRECWRDPWCFAGCYRCREDAVHAAQRYQVRGFEIAIR